MPLPFDSLANNGRRALTTAWAASRSSTRTQPTSASCTTLAPTPPGSPPRSLATTCARTRAVRPGSTLVRLGRPRQRRRRPWPRFGAADVPRWQSAARSVSNALGLVAAALSMEQCRGPSPSCRAAAGMGPRRDVGDCATMTIQAVRCAPHPPPPTPLPLWHVFLVNLRSRACPGCQPALNSGLNIGLVVVGAPESEPQLPWLRFTYTYTSTGPPGTMPVCSLHFAVIGVGLMHSSILVCPLLARC